MERVYNPIWVSSISHIEEFVKISKKNPLWKSMLFLNKVPSDFPQLHIGARKYPIVYFSTGELKIFERQIDFKAGIPAQIANSHYKNIDTKLKFEILFEDILTIERYSTPTVFLKYFNIKWVKIILKNNSADDLLISSGGTGLQVKNVMSKNDELYEIIKKRVLQY
jgi:hypothetical protein